MSGTYWIYRHALSDESKTALLNMVGHLPEKDIEQVVSKIEEKLGTYIQLKQQENDALLVSKQKKSINQAFELFIKFETAIMQLDQRTLDKISLYYQEHDIDKWIELKTIEHQDLKNSLNIVDRYVGLLRSGKELAYKGVTKDKINYRLSFIKEIKSILNKYSITTPAWTHDQYEKENPFHKLIRILLQQTVDNPEDIPENIPEIKHINK